MKKVENTYNLQKQQDLAKVLRKEMEKQEMVKQPPDAT